MSKWSDSGKEWEQPETGNQVARCIRVIELGTQEKEYQGQKSWKKQTLIVWELPNSLMSEGEHAGKPFTISQFYTASLSEKANLRRDLQSWRGKEFTQEELDGFDQKRIIGQPCLLNLIEKEGKVRVSTVSAIVRGMTIPPQVNESFFYDIDDKESGNWDKLSDGIKALIMKSKEWQSPTESNALLSEQPASHQAAGFGANDEDSIPFN